MNEISDAWVHDRFAVLCPESVGQEIPFADKLFRVVEDNIDVVDKVRPEWFDDRLVDYIIIHASMSLSIIPRSFHTLERCETAMRDDYRNIEYMDPKFVIKNATRLVAPFLVVPNDFNDPGRIFFLMDGSDVHWILWTIAVELQKKMEACTCGAATSSPEES